MNLQEVMSQLEAMGTEQNRKIYKRHEAREPLFGVSSANFKVLTKKIKIDHALAQQLWNTGNYDARILAMMIVDPQQITDELADAWAKDVNDYSIANYVSDSISRSPVAHTKIQQWMPSDEEYIGRIGWHMLGKMATNDATLPDSFFEPYLAAIERDIHTQKNRKREGMNSALIAIGARGGALQEKAMAAAKNIGKVHIDHGQTGCKTPDACTYILKIVARKQGEPVK